MTLANLENLVLINKLKVEPTDQYEFDGMVSAAKIVCRIHKSKDYQRAVSLH